MGIFVALAAVLAAAGLVLHERAKEGAALPLFLPSSFGPLSRDHVYRVWARVARADILENDLRSALLDLGFYEVLLAIEDPTDPRVWSFLARWGGDASRVANVPPLQVYRTEVIDRLPEDAVFSIPEMLDTDLTNAEAHAVHVALVRERDPDRLEAFSRTMIDDFPLAGVMLQARADALRAAGAAAT